MTSINKNRKKYKLLLVTTLSLTIRAFFTPYAEFFRKKGWSVDAACRWEEDDDTLKQFFHNTLHCDWNRYPWTFRNFRMAEKLRSYANENKPDIIHVHTPVAGFITRWAFRNFKYDNGDRPTIIYTAHGFHFHRYGNPIKNRVFLFFEKLASQWCSIIITINKEDYAATRSFDLIEADKSIYIPGVGIDIEAYEISSSSKIQHRIRLREELGLNEKAVCFLTVGELNPEKHQINLIKALSNLNIPNIHLIMAGTGPLQEMLQEEAIKCGVEDRVHFLGFRYDVSNLLQAADGFLFASSREGLPRCIMEAMAAEIPILAVDARGTRDLLENGCGRLVSHGNIREMTEKIGELLKNREENQIMISRAKEKIKSLNIGVILNMHQQLYRNLLSK